MPCLVAPAAHNTTGLFNCKQWVTRKGLHGHARSFFALFFQGSFVQQQVVARWKTGAAGPRKTRGGGAGALSMESTADFKNGMTIDIDGMDFLFMSRSRPGEFD